MRIRGVMGNIALPYDAEVEYLQSTGTQYIDTGIICTQDTEFEVEYKVVNEGIGSIIDVPIFGAWQYYGSRQFILRSPLARNRSYFYFGTDTKSIAFTSLNNLAKVKFHDKKCYLNDSLLGDYSSVGNFSTPKKLSIFAINSSTFGSAGSVQLFKFTISSSAVNLRDFIPVRVGQVGYLYDRVSGQLFGNSGTGSFILGADV